MWEGCRGFSVVEDFEFFVVMLNKVSKFWVNIVEFWDVVKC